METGDAKMPDKKNDDKKLETVDLLNQEVFATGEYTSSQGNKFKYDKAALEGMAAAANEMGDRLSAAVKLGHNNSQELAKLEGHFSDGMPSFGWMRNFRVKGEKLVADLKQVPAKLAALIQAGAFKYKSLEIHKNFKDEATGKKYKLLPVGVAILGKHMPALSNLNALAAMYDAQTETKDGVPVAEFWYKQAPTNSPDGGENHMSKELETKIASLTTEVSDLTRKYEAAKDKAEKLEKELKQVKDDHAKAAKAAEDKAEEAAEEHKKISDELETVKKENGELKTENDKFQKAVDDAASKEREAFLEKHSKKFPPVMKAHFMALLEQADAEPEKFSMDVDGEKITDIRKHIEDMPESELFTQHGKSSDPKDRSNDEEAKERKVRKYCKENDLNFDNPEHYAQAYDELGLHETN